ncbi:MAG TPA: hypothetical protein VGE00_11235, partial [Gammaproteobacteria bacterium]
KRLTQLFNRLGEGERATLLAFAEFLASRLSEPAAEPARVQSQVPLAIPRPEKETVIGAVKRLSATYPMVDRDKMLHETAGLMTQHMVQGRPAPEVIDELEQLFARHYQLYLGNSES